MSNWSPTSPAPKAEAVADPDPRRALLRRRRALATGALLVCAGVTAATWAVPDPAWPLRLLRAGAEAGLIGGLADWFAVTALFRRPLGLPIPHTAVIPEGRARVARGVARFVETHLLAPDALARWVRSASPAARLGAALSDPATARRLAERLSGALASVLRDLDDPALARFATAALRDKLIAWDAGRPLASGLRRAVASGADASLYDWALTTARRALAEHQELILDQVRRRTAWWTPRRLDDRIAAAVVDALTEQLAEMATLEHPAREGWRRALLRWAEQLGDSPEGHRLVARFKGRIAVDPGLRDAFDGLWDQLRHGLADAAGDPDGAVRRGLADSLRGFGERLCADARLRRRIDRLLALWVRRVAPDLRAEAGAFVEGLVNRWDRADLVDRLEVALGPDLQYVRINGALVGAAAGMALFGLAQLFGV